MHFTFAVNVALTSSWKNQTRVIIWLGKVNKRVFVVKEGAVIYEDLIRKAKTPNN